MMLLSMNPEYLTAPEVAERLRVTRMTVHRWIKAGHLKAIRIGHEYRIDSASLEQLISASEVAP